MRKLLPILLVLAVLLLSISGESLWIDEITTAFVAAADSFTDFCEAVAATGSEAQMPFFAFFIWIWAKLFGTSELALRCANIPLVVLGILAMKRFLSRSKCRPHALLLLTLPLLCFYMNEGRPYIMTFATGALALVSFDSILSCACAGMPGALRDRILFPVSIVLCVGTSMLNVFLLTALLAYALVILPSAGGPACRAKIAFRERCNVLIKSNMAGIAVGGTALLALAVYFYWTLRQGYGGQKEPFTIANLGFAGYEWLGFGGLGAPRNVLREIGPIASLKEYYPTIALGVAAWLLFGLSKAIDIKTIARDGVLWRVVAALVCGSGPLVAAAVLAPASLWGRHFMFLMPFFLVALARVLTPMNQSQGQGRRVVIFTFLALVFLLSSARQRFHVDYGKDPYRESVDQLREYCRTRPDVPIIWVSYGRAVSYYGGECVLYEEHLAAQPNDRNPRVLLGASWPAERIRAWERGHSEYVLLLHRPDKYDREGHWQRTIQRSGLTLAWQEGNIRIYHVERK